MVINDADCWWLLSLYAAHDECLTQLDGLPCVTWKEGTRRENGRPSCFVTLMLCKIQAN